jgi:hypothetical protein
MRLLPLLFVCACSTTPAMSDGGADAGDDATYDPHPQTPAWMTNAHVFVNGHGRDDQWDCRTQMCRHNENVDMTKWNGAYWLVHRTARSQVLGPNSSLHVYKSADGISFTDVATIQAPMDRDLRDPSFYVVGNDLYIKGLTRLPVNSDRDSNVQTITVATHSSDGVTWAPLQNIAPPTWSFWRIKSYMGVYYSAAYEDGDKSISMFSSTDGMTWTKGAQMYGVAADTPVETELNFLPSGRMLALVRTDGVDAVYLGTQGPIKTVVCFAMPPYTTFDCSQQLDGVRLDGPLSFFQNNRLWVVARKHLLDGSGKKRSALYEITGTLEGGPIAIKEWGEIPGAGDTSYAGIAFLDANRATVAWYSGDIVLDKPWVLGIFDLTDIWMAQIDFSQVK